MPYQPFIDSDLELNNNLLQALNTSEERYEAAIKYGAHLRALLRETCEILDKMEVNVDVSEALAFWWEMEKRKRGTKTSLVSSDGTPLRSRVGPTVGSELDQPEPRSSPVTINVLPSKGDNLMVEDQVIQEEVLNTEVTDEELQEVALNSFPTCDEDNGEQEVSNR